MLPITKKNSYNKTIYINPNFNVQKLPQETAAFQKTAVIPINAHINPLFLETRKCVNKIHMNPAFLQKFQDQQKNSVPENYLITQAANMTSNSLCEKTGTGEKRKIICKSKNILIREPLIPSSDHSTNRSKNVFPVQPLLLLNRRKLIRKVPFLREKLGTAETPVFNNLQGRNATKYKLDNRVNRKKPVLPPTPRIKRTSFVGRYALKRTSLSEHLKATAGKSLLIKNNKTLHVLNINGLLYKSTRNSLKLKSIKTAQTLKSTVINSSNDKKISDTNHGLTIFVRGNKYVMDANKFKLTRIPHCDLGSSNQKTPHFKAATCQRIDIGGYTFVSVNSAKNVLIRTKNHLSRAYVHNAKQKSLQTLIKRLVKTNIPCPIFQRIGKCAGFDRGKCSKMHNKLQVSICSKFLRGECLNSNCLLSHNVSLSKMPVCKFFLQGVCVRNDCPYLHKKLSEKTELCSDFLRGFCQKADKCNKRHEFLCPEIERNKECTTKNCVYCNVKRRKESQPGMKSGKLKNKASSTVSLAKNTEEFSENSHVKRYFIDACDMKISDQSDERFMDKDNNVNVTKVSAENIEQGRNSRPKLGTLPSYIPL